MAVVELDLPEELIETKEETQFSMVWRRFRRHRLALLGSIVIAVLIVMCALAPVFTPYDPLTQDLANMRQGPSMTHLLGTDELGRDMLSRLLYAGRISLTIGLGVAVLSELLGTIVGAIAGYYGGWVDNVLMRIVDLILTLPQLPILLILAAIFRDGGVPMLILILILLSWTRSSRVVRGTVLALRNQEFSEAARALGVSNAEIIMRHMIPNAMAPIIVGMTLAVGATIILESTLSFLGFGVQLPTATWGNLLQNAQSDMMTTPWKAVMPGFFIFMTSLSSNFMGDGLRDALDPRMKV